MTDAATLQLRRILALIPECADDRTHPIAEMAGRAGVLPNVLLTDIRALADRFDDPGGFVEGVAVSWSRTGSRSGPSIFSARCG